MSEQAYEQLTLFQEGFLVSPLVLPGSMEARRTTVTSGRKCLESYRNYSPLGCLVRTCLESSIWHSTRCFLRWKTQDTKHKRLLYRLQVSMRGTKESGSVLWPTPTTGAALCSGTGNFKQLQRLADKGLITEEERRQLSQGNGGKANPEWIEWLQGFNRTWTGLIPTPRSCDYKGAPYKRYVGGANYRSQLSELIETSPVGIIGKMNPTWTEWLTGYPIGWTELSA